MNHRNLSSASARPELNLAPLPSATLRAVFGADYPMTGGYSLPELVTYLEHAAVALFNIAPADRRAQAVAGVFNGTSVPTPTGSAAPVKKDDGELTGRARVEAAIAKNPNRERGWAESDLTSNP